MNLLEFRQRWPYKPNQLVTLNNGQLAEIMSFPYNEDNGGVVYVQARLNPGDPTTLTEVPVSNIRPTIVVIHDYDGYFEALVRSWIVRKVHFKHHTVKVNSGPYRMDAVSYNSHDGVILFDFYAALRNGFGMLSDEDVEAILEVI